jgi:uncharacterized protein (DUF1800 family)
MKSSVSRPAVALLCLSIACAVPQLLAKKKDTDADSTVDAQKRAVHALNRLTFGPRPGDVQQVMAMGVDRWVDLQLHPDKIPDSALEARLAPLRTLQMNPRQLAENFPDNQMIKQVYDGKRPMPSDPAQRAIYQVQIARLDEKLANQQRASAVPAPAPAPQPSTQPGASDGAKTAEELAAAAAAMPETPPPDIGSMNAMNGNGDTPSASADDPAMTSAPKKLSPEEEAEARAREEQLYADLKTTSTVSDLIALPPDARFKKVLAMSANEQFDVVESFRGGKGPAQEILTGLSPSQKEVFMAMNNPQQVVVQELSEAKLLRAIYSERQFEQVMTDFWFNHFNVFAGKGPERLLLTNYEQEVIRPHALGKFEDLLLATAKSPAMLFYLDNWMSVGPNSLQAIGAPVVRYGPYGRPHVVPGGNPNARRKQNSGLNENYGRELLELHTLSVNGGYSQRDVTEVAKVFTGWTIEKLADGATFRYDPRMHEPGPKFVLGHHIKPKGEDEGREVIHMLATSPQTAHFISLKLAQRFVSDDPPPALVDRMAKTFQKKKGDIREVLLTLFHSPEFWSDTTYRAKVKTPLEFVASAVRATGADVQDALPLVQRLNNMGMPLYGAQPPTGYSMKADTWVSSSALLTRMNFALALTAGKVRGVTVDAVQLAGGPPPPPDPAMALSTMEAKLLASDVSKQTHDSIVAQLASPASSAKNASPQPSANGAKPKKPDANRPPDASTMAGLLLGSPEFQRR